MAWIDKRTDYDYLKSFRDPMKAKIQDGYHLCGRCKSRVNKNHSFCHKCGQRHMRNSEVYKND